MGDFIAGLLNFEGKFWRTLPMLAWRPGEMTRRYIAGERARFISPVALYLFTVFAMFAVLNFTGALNPSAESFKNELRKENSVDQKAIAKLEAKRKDPGNAESRAGRNRSQDRKAQGGILDNQQSDYRSGLPGRRRWTRTRRPGSGRSSRMQPRIPSSCR